MATGTIEISQAERVKRCKIFERACLLVESEGLQVPAQVLAQGDRYIAGEIEIEDALKENTGRERLRTGRSR